MKSTKKNENLGTKQELINNMEVITFKGFALCPFCEKWFTKHGMASHMTRMHDESKTTNN